MKFTALNLGCKVNAYETECIASMFEERGWERVTEDEACDAFLVFTCAVTNTAAAKSRKVIHRARRNSPGCVLVVAGCYAQIDADALAEADIIVGSAGKKTIPDKVEQFLKDGIKVRAVELSEKPEFEEMTLGGFSHQTRAYLRIQDGCNQFCSYCVIPYARGRERSMDPDAAVKAASVLAKRHREIVLTGIHTGRYGKEYGVSLAQLMKRILQEAEGLERLRISSIEVTELDEEFITLLKEDTRIARHLHIPLQSGSDRILKAMHRPYDTDVYYRRISEIREAVSDLSVSCDLITGFPSESDEEHAQALAFAEKCALSFLHVFPYSPRANTEAAAMKEQIAPEVKKKRTAEFLALSERLYDRYKDTWIGRQAELLAETVKDGQTRGYTSQYVPLTVNAEMRSGEIIPVRITERTGHEVHAERIYL